MEPAAGKAQEDSAGAAVAAKAQEDFAGAAMGTVAQLDSVVLRGGLNLAKQLKPQRELQKKTSQNGPAPLLSHLLQKNWSSPALAMHVQKHSGQEAESLQFELSRSFY